MILEICCSTIHDVQNAMEAGADRIELCQALATGGLTPSPALITHAAALVRKAGKRIHVLIRPREGDFVYDEEERKLILEEIRFCREADVDGVVIGALTPDNEIDLPFCQAMMEEAGPLSVTYSRAFDICSDIKKALADVKKLGCDRILTSGGKATAAEGIEMLKELQQEAGEKPVILAASGIRATNFEEIIRMSGVSEIHGSFGKPVEIDPRISSQPGLDLQRKEADATQIKQVANRLKELDNE